MVKSSEVLLILILLMCVVGASGCNYLFPSLSEIKPAKTEINEEYRAENPPFRKYSKRIVIKIIRGNGEVEIIKPGADLPEEGNSE